MVVRVDAWKAADGSIHTTEHLAACHDAVKALADMDVFNHASANAIVKSARTILPILQQVVTSWPEETKEDTRNA